MEIGLTFTSTTVVDNTNTAVALGSGNMEVFATPAMVALMENAAMNAVAPHLEAGQTTVGTEISTTHIKASA
ncbi:MAG: dihydrolipoamide acyltransferase, partial [Alistipes sp.]|nr:dihydrolipoamide acyltransferase [Alistipes sp.]